MRGALLVGSGKAQQTTRRPWPFCSFEGGSLSSFAFCWCKAPLKDHQLLRAHGKLHHHRFHQTRTTLGEGGLRKQGVRLQARLASIGAEQATDLSLLFDQGCLMVV